MSFKILGVAPQLISQLESMSIVVPLPIQELSIPAALRGEDIIVKSQTVSGKTLAYLIPLLQRLSADKGSALILAPTRELAQQIGAICEKLCKAVRLKSCVIVGGVEYEPQRQALLTSPEIIVATPGRLIDLIEKGIATINGIKFLVIDEVDQMLDLGFREPILLLSKLRDTSAQTLCYSATLPEEVLEVVEQITPSASRLRIEGKPIAVESIEHMGYYVAFSLMDSLLLHLLRKEAPQQAIIFTRSRKMAQRVVALLSENGITSEDIHSDRTQAAREHILSRFRSGETKILVATDVIARGIDVDSVTHIFNFGLPQTPEQYIHRCGRTGRAGRAGRAISIFTPEEQDMVGLICKLMKRHIVIDNSHPYFTSEITQALQPKVATKRGKGRRR